MVYVHPPPPPHRKCILLIKCHVKCRGGGREAVRERGGERESEWETDRQLYTQRRRQTEKETARVKWNLIPSYPWRFHHNKIHSFTKCGSSFNKAHITFLRGQWKMKLHELRRQKWKRVSCCHALNHSKISFIVHYTRSFSFLLMLGDDSKKMKLKEPGWQKLEKQKSWLWLKYGRITFWPTPECH